jgi:ubiquinone/menaquinone biosynthesis C-methylase UbiE
LVRVADAQPCCDPVWEAAYRRFETPEEEIRKFSRRLDRLGQRQWPRSTRVVELFCGRGNGMVALQRAGFFRVEGVDLSESLLRQYQGSATCYVADCRDLPFADGSKDLITIHGGLHHLANLPEDLDRVLQEAQRVLTDDGLLAIVEPWMTPFLAFFHFVAARRLVRRAWDKIDASATMMEREAETYQPWLSQPELVLGRLKKYFDPERCRIGWGKICFLGRSRASAFSKLEFRVVSGKALAAGFEPPAASALPLT